MSVTTETKDGITSIIFTYKATTERVVEFASLAAHFLATTYGDGTPFEDMTNAQKLQTLDRYLFAMLHEARIGQAARDGDAAKDAIIEAARQEPPLTAMATK